MSETGNSILLVSNSGFNPRFTWQVGLNSDQVNPSDIYFRSTIRPLYADSQYSRRPSDQVLFEQTGIQFSVNSGIGYWEFPLSTNIALPGGPYRDYQVVIEAHDSNGYTSAGNRIGTTGEQGWPAYPNGYDIILINNQRITGIELVGNLDTYDVDGPSGIIISGVTGQPYRNNSYIGPNGDVSIQFTSGTFSENIIGGYIYLSTGQFPKIDAAINTGYWGEKVKKSQFSFNSVDKYIYSSRAASHLTGRSMGYVSISFYDRLDREYINQGINIGTGLYISNNAPIYNDSAIGRLSLGGAISLQTIRYTGDFFAQFGYGVPIDFNTATILGSGTSNDTTVILYMYPGSGLTINW